MSSIHSAIPGSPCMNMRCLGSGINSVVVHRFMPSTARDSVPKRLRQIEATAPRQHKGQKEVRPQTFQQDGVAEKDKMR